MRLNGSDFGERIHDHLVGRSVEMVGKDGQWLILYMSDGHRYRIGWQDSTGPIKGEPFLAGQDVQIMVQGVTLEGITKL